MEKCGSRRTDVGELAHSQHEGKKTSCGSAVLEGVERCKTWVSFGLGQGQDLSNNRRLPFPAQGPERILLSGLPCPGPRLM